MPLYESTFIARQDISSQQVEALAERFSGIITEQGGAVQRTEHWGLKSLAYRIRKNRKGHYVMLLIEAPAAAVQEMERNMRIDEDVLRYMTLAMEAMPEGPSAMLQSRAGRDERGRRDGPRGDRFDRFDRGDRGDRPRRPDRAADEPGATEGRVG